MMTAVSLINAMIEPAGRTSRRPVNRLRPGDRIVAKVLDIGKDGMVRLDLGRFTATAALSGQVSVGMRLPLEVVKSAGKLLLRVRERKRRADPKATPRLVADDDLGMPKGLHRKPLQADMVQRAQHRVDSAAGEADHVFGLSIPATSPKPPARHHVYARRRKQTDAQKIHQVAMSLSLRPMGDVRAEISLAPEGLRVTLRVTEENALEYVAQHQEALESALAALAPSVRVDALRHTPESNAGGEPPSWVHTIVNARVNVDV